MRDVFYSRPIKTVTPYKGDWLRLKFAEKYSIYIHVAMLIHDVSYLQYLHVATLVNDINTYKPSPFIYLFRFAV